jgi:hypothetical protein
LICHAKEARGWRSSRGVARPEVCVRRAEQVDQRLICAARAFEEILTTAD